MNLKLPFHPHHKIPDQPPLIIGPHGTAWEFDMAEIGRRFPGVHATVANWLIYCPEAHPIWHSYWITLAHLRKQSGLPSPIIYLDGATNEMVLHAIDPDWAPDLGGIPRFLSPANFAAQIIERSDVDAYCRVTNILIEICEGHLSPDTDWTQHWIARYGSSMIKGDPGRAGETIIAADYGQGKSERLVLDPKPLTQYPFRKE